MSRRAGNKNEIVRSARIIESVVCLCIIFGIIFGIVGYGVWWAVHAVAKYHDENTFADLCVTVTEAERQEDDREINLADDDATFENGELTAKEIKETYVKGNQFTIRDYMFEVEDVEFKYAVIKIAEGNLMIGNKEFSEGETYTLSEGQSISFTTPETKDTITIKLEKLWWY